MAHPATRPAASLVLLAALPALAACAAPEPPTAGTSDRRPSFGSRPSPRMRAPSAERPAWLPHLPADPPRVPAPSDGFRG
jgi:hypothetical protein